MQARLFWAAGIRGWATGAAGVLLGLYFAERGSGGGTLGVVVGAGLAGGALATALVPVLIRWLGTRRTLVLVTGLSAAGLGGMAVAGTPWLLLLVAFIGMVNGFGRDRGPAQTVDQSLLAGATSHAERTRAFAAFTFLQDASGAVGALCAGLPALLQRLFGVPGLTAYHASFAVLAALSALAMVPYAGIRETPRAPPASRAERTPMDRATRRRIGGLAALTGLDSLGGGFLSGAILSFWFFRRFGLSPEALGAVFFGARVLNAASYVAAARLARDIGLVRTMVFTHLASSALLLALPHAGGPAVAVGLFFAREALVQMDVPTRQSYITAVVPPDARVVALSLTGIVRSAGWAAGAPLAGTAMVTLGLAAPLYCGATLKIVYDLLLFAGFRRVRPPEEA
jgi:predicted MFS family arabinose efflux permease